MKHWDAVRALVDINQTALVKLASAKKNCGALWGMHRPAIQQFASTPKMENDLFKYVFEILVKNTNNIQNLGSQFPKSDETLGYIFVYAALLQRYDNDPTMTTLGASAWKTALKLNPKIAQEVKRLASNYFQDDDVTRLFCKYYLFRFCKKTAFSFEMAELEKVEPKALNSLPFLVNVYKDNKDAQVSRDFLLEILKMADNSSDFTGHFMFRHWESNSEYRNRKYSLEEFELLLEVVDTLPFEQWDAVLLRNDAKNWRQELERRQQIQIEILNA